MSTPANIIRAYDAKIDDVRAEDMSLVCRVNTADVDYYKTVLHPKGIRFDNYRTLGQPILWEHGKDLHRRFTDPIGNAVWIKHSGGTSPTEIIARPRFLKDDFSRQRWEWYRDEVIKGWSINILPDMDTVGPPTKEELKTRPDWEQAQTVFRSGTMVEFSGTVLPGNPRALTDSRAAKVMDLVQRGLLWLPEEAEPIYREAASRTTVLMPGGSPPVVATDSGGMASGGAAVKPSVVGEDDEDDEATPKRPRKAPMDAEPPAETPPEREAPQGVARRIRKRGGRFYVQSEDGKNLGDPDGYPTEEAAQHRLQQIEYFKHQGEGERSAAGATPMGSRSLETPAPAQAQAPAPDPPDDEPVRHDGHGGWTLRDFPGPSFPDRATALQALALLREAPRFGDEIKLLQLEIRRRAERRAENEQAMVELMLTGRV